MKDNTTGLRWRLGKITTKILSEDAKGVAGQGSFRAERTASTAKRKGPHHFRNDWWKTPFRAS